MRAPRRHVARNLDSRRQDVATSGALAIIVVEAKGRGNLVRDITRLGVVLFFLAAVFAQVGAIAGCSGSPFTADGHDPGMDFEHTGSVGFELEVAGVTLHNVAYAISGNGFSKQGDVDVSHSPTLSAVIGGIPAGDGFTIIITATSPDGSVTCIGSATFSVMDGVITNVTIHLQCHFGQRPGRIDVSGIVNLCPTFEDLSVAPIETTVGGTITLLTRLGDADGPVSALRSTFSDGATSLSLNGVGTSAIGITCTQAGPGRITLTVSDGECLQATAVDVSCSGPGAGPQATWTWKQLDPAP